MAVSKKTLSGVILQIAVALFLVVSGILTVQLDGGILSQAKSVLGGNELASAVYKVFGRGDFTTIIVMILGICELIAGVFLLINFFVDTAKVTNIFLLVIIILWLIVIALVDIMGNGGLLGGAFNSMNSVLSFLKNLSAHLLVLGALLVVWKK